jgi:hypothetical protein
MLTDQRKDLFKQPPRGPRSKAPLILFQTGFVIDATHAWEGGKKHTPWPKGSVSILNNVANLVNDVERLGENKAIIPGFWK